MGWSEAQAEHIALRYTETGTPLHAQEHKRGDIAFAELTGEERERKIAAACMGKVRKTGQCVVVVL